MARGGLGTRRGIALALMAMGLMVGLSGRGAALEGGGAGLGGPAAGGGRVAAQAGDAPTTAGDEPLLPGLPPGTRVGYHPETGRVRFLGAPPGGPLSEGPALAAGGAESVARAFLAQHGALFGVADAAHDLRAARTVVGSSGRAAVRYQQYYQGVPVLAGELVVQVHEGQRVLAMAGEALPNPAVDVAPRVTPDEACLRARQAVGRARGIDLEGLTCAEPALWIYNPTLLGAPGPRRDRLVWRTEVRDAEAAVRELVLVDAHIGAVSLRFRLHSDALNREIHDNANQPYVGLPGALVRTEGAPPSGLADADAAYQSLGDTYNLFHEWHGRDGWDDAGATIVATTRYCATADACPYQNAYWSGEQLVFGDGYTQADDVVAHEFTHAVTDHTSNLFYYMQSGAINEALSDIWGEFVDLTNGHDGRGGSVQWVVGEDLPEGAMRSLSDPTAYTYSLDGTSWHAYADRMTHPGYYCGSLDNGGVHLNSGIAAKAAYLLAAGDTFNGYTVAALGMPKTAALFYEAQTQLLTSGAGYADLGDALIQAAINLATDGSLAPGDVAQVQRAVAAVEMSVQPPACAVTEAPLCTEGTPQSVFFDDLENPAAGNWASAGLAGMYNTFYYPQNPNALDFDASYASSGVMNIWGYDQQYIADFAMAMTRDVVLPANAYLRFSHAHAFEALYLYGAWLHADGGVVEYSTDGGTSWHDAGSLFGENGYTGVIVSWSGNPLGGRQAFVSASQGYTASRLDLGALAGKPFRLRFRMGTDDGGDNYGWFIDDIHIYTCLDEPPTLIPSPVAPSATPTLSPPTATATPMPPTATPTQRPPSATPTPIPPTATATPAPSATPHRVRLPAVLAG